MTAGEPAQVERKQPARAGRPRTDARASGSSRQDILQVAARLFAEVGYANTTMSDIARAAGLHQSSLYYWFRRKEMILHATLEVNRLPVAFLERLRSEEGTAGLKLYRLLRFDTYQLCMSPFDVNEVERQAEQQPEVFVGYWEDNQRLYEGVASLVGMGVDSGEFIECRPALISLSLLSTQEGMQKRFRYQARHASSLENPFVYDAYDAATVAAVVAETAVRSLLRHPEHLAEVQRLAGTYHDF